MKCPKCGHEFAVEKSARELQLEQDRIKLEGEMTTLYQSVAKLEAERRNVELEIAKRSKEEAQKEADRVSALLTAELQRVTTQQRQEAELRLAEKTKVISDLESKLTDALQKAQLTSSQLRGEVQEIELEQLLRETFDKDEIKPVPKGKFGGDCIQTVSGVHGVAGTILWESKRTKTWSAGWIDKMVEDQRSGQFDFAILMSCVVPEEVEKRGFGIIKSKGGIGIWVCTPATAMVLAAGLRMALLSVRAVKTLSDQKASKQSMLYDYVSGPLFKQRLEAMLEYRSSLLRGVETEKNAMNKAWASQLTLIDKLGETLVAMAGEIEGQLGTTLLE